MSPEVAWLIAGLAGTSVLLSPVMIVRMILKHRERLEKIKRGGSAAPEIAQEMAALRREVAALRETTTKFDVSFDAAIDRLEERVQRLEQPGRGTASAASETETVLRGR